MTLTQQKFNDLERDIDDTGKALNTKAIITPRFGDKFKSLPLAVQEVIETGGFEPFKTEVQLLASIPVLTKKAAKALDTQKIWLWENGVWTDMGLSEYDLALTGKNNLAMMWFFQPYYEFDGTNLYFRPTARALTPFDFCFCIRASKYPDAEIKIGDFYTQLAAIGADKFKVTSPLGVTDCIKFTENQCLYYDHDIKKFIFGYRQDVVAQNRTLMIHLNFNEIGPCIRFQFYFMMTPLIVRVTALGILLK